MRFELRSRGQVAVVDIRGKITVGHGDAVLRTLIIELLKKGRREILLDLRNTTYMDSCGLAELVASYRRVRQQHGTLKLINPTARVRDLLRVTRLEEVFEIHADEDAALASLHPLGNERLGMLLMPRPTPFMI